MFLGIVISFFAFDFSTSSMIRCPGGIPRFGAYPGDTIDDPAFFYDCTRTKYAVLKRCLLGAFFDTEHGKCRTLDTNYLSSEIFRNKSSSIRRSKRDIDQDMKEHIVKSGIKEESKPSLGEPIKLGALYYGAEDRIQFDENLWRDETIKKKATITDIQKSKFKIRSTMDILERLSLFALSASIRADFLNGKFVIGGSVKFLNEGRKSVKQVSVSYFHESARQLQSIGQDMRAQDVDYPEMCRLAGREDGPTHVVSSISRGIRAVFEFQKNADNESNALIKGLSGVFMGTSDDI